MKENIISRKAFNFSLEIIKLFVVMTKQNEFIISKQLLKSATSIGANIEEAIAAQSKNDFISKMSIASKESRETRYWLKLLNESSLIKYDFPKLLIEVDVIIKILTKIVKTSRNRI